MTDLEQLAERVEALSGPDREVDADIALTQGWHELPGDNWIGPEVKICVPAYTASLDAAMSLVPEGYVMGSLKQRTRYEIVEAKNNSVDLSEQAAWSAWVHKDTNDRTFRVGLRFSHHGAAATPALALTAAALRARK